MTQVSPDKKRVSHPLTLDDKVIIGIIVLALLYIVLLTLLGVLLGVH